MNVRNAQDGDHFALVRLIAAFRVELAGFRGSTPLPDLEAAKGELNSYHTERYQLFVAERDGLLAGYVVCRVDGQTVWAESLFVLPEYRRNGVGSCLYAKAEELAFSVGSRTVYNWIHPNNDGIISFLKRRGYDVLNLVEVRRAGQGEQLNHDIQVGNHRFRY